MTKKLERAIRISETLKDIDSSIKTLINNMSEWQNKLMSVVKTLSFNERQELYKYFNGLKIEKYMTAKQWKDLYSNFD